MTINDKIAEVLISAEVDDKGLKDWDEAIDDFVFYEVEQMTYGWNLDDEEFESFKNGIKEAILAQVDFNKVQEIIDDTMANALERITEIFDRKKDWGWK